MIKIAALKKIVSRSALFTIAHMLEAMVPIVLVPILTRTMLPTEYGIWALFLSLTTFVFPIISLRMDDALRMRFNDLSEQRLPHYIFTIIGFILANAVIFIVLVTIFESPLESVAAFPGGWFWAFGVTSLLYGIFYLFLAYFQFRGEIKHFMLAHGICMTVSIVLSVVFVLLGGGWQSLVIAKIIGLLAVSVYCLVVFYQRYKSFTFEKKYVKELAGFGIKYLPKGLMTTSLPLVNRLFIVHMVSFEQAGFYAIGQLFGFVLMIVVRGFYFAWLPWLFRRLKALNPDNKKEIAAVLGLFFLLLPVGSGILIVVAEFLAPYVIGEAFLDASHYIFWLVIAHTLEGFLVLSTSFIHFTKKVEWISVCSLTALIANVLLCFYLVPIYGGIGAAYATIGAYALAFVVSIPLSFYLLRRYYKTEHTMQEAG